MRGHNDDNDSNTDDSTTDDTSPLLSSHRNSDSSSDDQTAFALALYARIHSSSPPSTPTDTPAHSPTPLVVADAHVRSARAKDETGASDDCARLPSTFVARVTERLRSLCACDHAVGEASEAADGGEAPSLIAAFASFLDRAEQQLTEQYDQLVMERPHDDDAPPPAGLPAVDSERAKQLFHERYGTSLDTLTQSLDRVVQGLVDDYRTYYANERQLLDAAERYDRLDTWVQQAKTLFGDDERNADDTGNIAESSSSPQQPTPFDTLLQHRLKASPEWANTFHDAQHTWQRLQTSRYALRQLEALLGGRQGCRICFNQQVGVVLVPCGHVLCASCAEKVTTCPFCNTAFYSKQQMYFV